MYSDLILQTYDALQAKQPITISEQDVSKGHSKHQSQSRYGDQIAKFLCFCSGYVGTGYMAMQSPFDRYLLGARSWESALARIVKLQSLDLQAESHANELDVPHDESMAAVK